LLVKPSAVLRQETVQDLTYLGHLGQDNTNRIISICVESPKVSKASKGGVIVLPFCRCFSLPNLPKYTSLKLCLDWQSLLVSPLAVLQQENVYLTLATLGKTTLIG
jgi:hypothetical protein